MFIQLCKIIYECGLVYFDLGMSSREMVYLVFTCVCLHVCMFYMCVVCVSVMCVEIHVPGHGDIVRCLSCIGNKVFSAG